jgi:FKBP-type peptidyl-prolyl cis-trans isomerase
MNKISNVLVGILVVMCMACNKEEVRETPNGFKYTLVESGDGVKPQKEEILVFDFLLKDSKDSVWHNTEIQGTPSAVMIQDSTALASESGIVQMFRMLSKGDSVLVTMPVPEFFRDVIRAPIPPDVDTTLNLSYCLRVNDIMKMDDFRAFQEDAMTKKRVSQKEKDASLISKYLTDNNINAQQDTSGLSYLIHSNNGGSKPTVDNCVEVKYTGRFLKDGKVFDQSDKISFPLNAVIPGWQKAIPMLGIGDSATFYIPSGLAYGPEGAQGAIPPDAILIFDVELLGFGGQYDQGTGTCK